MYLHPDSTQKQLCRACFPVASQVYWDEHSWMRRSDPQVGPACTFPCWMPETRTPPLPSRVTRCGVLLRPPTLPYTSIDSHFVDHAAEAFGPPTVRLPHRRHAMRPLLGPSGPTRDHALTCSQFRRCSRHPLSTERHARSVIKPAGLRFTLEHPFFVEGHSFRPADILARPPASPAGGTPGKPTAYDGTILPFNDSCYSGCGQSHCWCSKLASVRKERRLQAQPH